MTRQINFEEDDVSYKFIEGDVTFAISKTSLEFDTKKFYECFFKDLTEKPDIELVPREDLVKNSKHVYDTVFSMVKDICEQIDEDWFKKDDSEFKDEQES